MSISTCREVGFTLCRPEALNALNSDLVRGLGEVVAEIRTRKGIQGRKVRGLILRGADGLSWPAPT